MTMQPPDHIAICASVSHISLSCSRSSSRNSFEDAVASCLSVTGSPTVELDKESLSSSLILAFRAKSRKALLESRGSDSFAVKASEICRRFVGRPFFCRRKAGTLSFICSRGVKLFS